MPDRTSEPAQRFTLARMDTTMRVMTWIFLPLPAVFAVFARLAPPPGNLVLVGCAWFTGLMWLGIWTIGRPTRFDITAGALDIVWPVRRRSIPRSDITGATILTGAEFKARYGWAMRIGAGGLWGGFGRLKTARGGTMELWLSRLEPLVVIERRVGRDLLVTPENPSGFVAALGFGGTAQR